MDPFEKLPEECISEILQHTSPLEASRSSTLSKSFKAAAESNNLWDKFLPQDYQEILSGSSLSSSVKFATKKDLYFSLCHDPVLLDGGTMSFSVDKRNGKKCFMIGARQLMISWKGCWDFTSHANSRFSEVAKLRSIGWIHIQGKIKTQILSKNTTYAACLVFWLESMDGLKSSSTIVRFLDDRSKNGTNNEILRSRETGKIARKRGDGWMEIEMGKFYNGYKDNGEVEAWLIDINSLHGMSGLIVEGIEFRPV